MPEFKRFGGWLIDWSRVYAVYVGSWSRTSTPIPESISIFVDDGRPPPPRLEPFAVLYDGMAEECLKAAVGFRGTRQLRVDPSRVMEVNVPSNERTGSVTFTLASGTTTLTVDWSSAIDLLTELVPPRKPS